MQENPLIVFREQLAELCERYHVRYLYAFGSVVTNRYIPGKSDIDLIVELEEMPPEQKGEMLLNFWDELEHLLHSKVDLLTNSIIKNAYLRNSVNATKKLIYDGAGKEILI